MPLRRPPPGSPRRSLPPARAGFTLAHGADGKEIEVSIERSSRSVKDLNKEATGRGGFFSRDTQRDTEKGMKALVKHLEKVRDLQRDINKELREREKLFRRMMAAMQPKRLGAAQQMGVVPYQGGGGVVPYQTGGQLLLPGHVPDGMTPRQRRAQRHPASMQPKRSLENVADDEGKKDRRKEWMKRANGVARSIATWAFEKYRDGAQVLAEQQAARLQSEAMSSPHRRGWGALEGGAHRMGFRRVEAQAAYQSMARASGQLHAGGALSNLAMQRAYGIDGGAITGFQRASRNAGDTTIVEKVNQALVTSFKRTKLPRALLTGFLEQSTQLLGQMSGGREVVHGQEAAALLSAFQRAMGGTYARSPSRAGGLLSRVGQTIENPGGGEAGQAFMLRAMGFGDGKTDYVDALIRGDKGMTGDNIRRLIGQVKKEYGGMSSKMQALALARLSGGKVKIHESLRLLGMDQNNLSDDALKGTLRDSQKVDLVQEARSASKRRLGIQMRGITRENDLAKFAANSQNLAKIFHNIERKIMSAATALASSFDRVAGTAISAARALGWISGSTRKAGDKSKKGGKRPNQLRAGRNSEDDDTDGQTGG